MTTILLAQNYLSLKSSKIALDKIQHLKKRNMREMAETKKSLQSMITKYRVPNSCRLCLRSAETNIFNNTMGINFVEDIRTFFNIKVRQNDGKPQYICTDCANTLRKVVELKHIAELAQWRLEQEAELGSPISLILSDGACDDNDITDDKADDGNNDDEEIIVYHVDAPKCKQCHQVPSKKNDCELCQEDTKKPRRVGSYVCERCGLELKTAWGLKTHMVTHTNDFNFPCGYCPFRAKSCTSLKIHERRHTGDRPYMCVQCNRTFISASNFASHRRLHLPPAFKCDICLREFKFKQPLINHIATQHRNAKPFSCCDCGNAFATRLLLRRHEIKTHNRPRMRPGTTPSYIIPLEDIDEESQDEA